MLFWSYSVFLSHTQNLWKYTNISSQHYLLRAYCPYTKSEAIGQTIQKSSVFQGRKGTTKLLWSISYLEHVDLEMAF